MSFQEVRCSLSLSLSSNDSQSLFLKAKAQANGAYSIDLVPLSRLAYNWFRSHKALSVYIAIIDLESILRCEMEKNRIRSHTRSTAYLNVFKDIFLNRGNKTVPNAKSMTA